jgi:hypothetical protein
MITRPTVLLLGAGASAPYGFPTGTGLRDRICKVDASGLSTAQASLVQAGYAQEEVQGFINQLRNSGRVSVDAFLEHRPDLLRIGKAAIAAALLPFERPDALFEDLELNGRWYAHLLEQLDAPRSDWHKNRLTIITYNYDRSLEYFLTRALARSFDVPDADAPALLSALPIIHLHGQLGSLADVDHGGRPFSPEITARRLEIAAAGIQIVSEANPDTHDFRTARAALADAGRTFILGFAYNRTNLDRLGRAAFPEGRWRVGSCYGMLDGQLQEVQGWFQGRIQLGPDRTILDFLRHHTPLRAD